MLRQRAIPPKSAQKAPKKTDRKIARKAVMDCPPSNSAADLAAWRDQAIQKIYETPAVNGTNQKDLSDIQTTVDRCWPDGAVPSCLQDLSDYSRTLPRGGHTDLYSSELAVRSERELPKDFWVDDGNGGFKEGVIQLPKDLLAIAESKGWKVASHRTRGQGGFETGPNLLIIGVPTDKYDFVFQIELPRGANISSTVNEPAVNNGYPIPLTQDQYSEETSGGSSKFPTVVTLITADKRKRPVVGQLRFLNRTVGSAEIPWSNKGDYESCSSCHVTPYRDISPMGYKNLNGEEKRMSSEQEKAVDGINQFMDQHMGMSWGKAKQGDKIVDFGPPADGFPLGWNPNPASRTSEYIDACKTRVPAFSANARGGIYSSSFKQTPEGVAAIRNDKVAQAMNCTMCHSGQMRGPITPLFSDTQIQMKVVMDRLMPPTAPDLTNDERLALVGCLFKEREELRDEWLRRGEWLKKAQCKSGSGSGSGTRANSRR